MPAIAGAYPLILTLNIRHISNLPTRHIIGQITGVSFNRFLNPIAHKNSFKPQNPLRLRNKQVAIHVIFLETRYKILYHFDWFGLGCNLWPNGRHFDHVQCWCDLGQGLEFGGSFGKQTLKRITPTYNFAKNRQPPLQLQGFLVIKWIRFRLRQHPVSFLKFRSQVLYHFDWFGRHASQGLWSWPNSVTCPLSQPLWPTTFGGSKKWSTKAFKKIFTGVGHMQHFFLLMYLRRTLVDQWEIYLRFQR